MTQQAKTTDGQTTAGDDATPTTVPDDAKPDTAPADATTAGDDAAQKKSGEATPPTGAGDATGNEVRPQTGAAGGDGPGDDDLREENSALRALQGSGAIDADAAELLLRRTMRARKLPAAEALKHLKKDKPHLFTQTSNRAPSATTTNPPPTDDTDKARKAASKSGDRKAVMEYLRKRRQR